MKRMLCLAVLAFGLWAMPHADARETSMSVQIRTAQLRADPSFLGRVAGTLEYGARVTIAEERGEWRRVTGPNGAQGWIHQSALTTKKIAMQAGAADVSTAASGQELALAGKGFSSEVEADFKKKNANVDFTWIDRMEKIKVTPAEMLAFLKEGQVVPEGSK